MASLFILSRRIRLYPNVVLSAAPAGIIGMTFGALFVELPYPYPRIVFTCMITVFGLAFHLANRLLKHEPDYNTRYWKRISYWHFWAAGFLGGIISSLCGSGIDMIVYIVMTLAYGMHEKKAIPTSVIVMTIISLYGFFWHGVVARDISIEWNYWAVCVPIVAIGAPLGALVASIVSRQLILGSFTLLIIIDLISTIVLIEMNAMTSGIMILITLVSSLVFWVMLQWRQADQNTKAAMLNTGSTGSN
jgi:Predicted permeases